MRAAWLGCGPGGSRSSGGGGGGSGGRWSSARSRPAPPPKLPASPSCPAGPHCPSARAGSRAPAGKREPGRGPCFLALHSAAGVVSLRSEVAGGSSTARSCPPGGRDPLGQRGRSGPCPRPQLPARSPRRHVDAALWRDGLAGRAGGRAGSRRLSKRGT